MIFLNDISELSIYSDNNCYCEEIINPSDVILQGILARKGANAPYTLTIYVYDIYGTTELENATDYFQYYFGVVPATKQHFFNARLSQISPVMCSSACFVLRFVATQNGITYFDKYTERYCVNDCCAIPTGISVTQDDITTPLPETTPTTPSDIAPNRCGIPLIKLISTFDCIDNFTGEYYGTPSTVLNGTANFTNVKVSTFRGRIEQRPITINVERSYNCRLQKIESEDVYYLEGAELFPAWKMGEIEGQLRANRIYVDNYYSYREYKFNGGTPFAQLTKKYEVFGLKTTLNGCKIRQIFGCGQPCNDTDSLVFPISGEVDTGTIFFDVAGNEIANDMDGLVQWFNSQDGITSAYYTTLSPYSCDGAITGMVIVEGDGEIPTSFYAGGVSAQNKVYGITTDEATDVCGQIPVIACATPTLSGVAIYSMPVCGTPSVQGIIIYTITATNVSINGYSVWVADTGETSASVYNGFVEFSLKVTNSTIVGTTGDEFYYTNERIGVIAAMAAPTQDVSLDSTNSSVPAGLSIIITTLGNILLFGTVTVGATPNELTVDLDNINYNING